MKDPNIKIQDPEKIPNTKIQGEFRAAAFFILSAMALELGPQGMLKATLFANYELGALALGWYERRLWRRLSAAHQRVFRCETSG
jgi:hypothetical protein